MTLLYGVVNNFQRSKY